MKKNMEIFTKYGIGIVESLGPAQDPYRVAMICPFCRNDISLITMSGKYQYRCNDCGFSLPTATSADSAYGYLSLFDKALSEYMFRRIKPMNSNGKQLYAKYISLGDKET